MLTRRLFLAAPLVVGGCTLLRKGPPAPLPAYGVLYRTAQGMHFRWPGPSARYLSSDDAAAAIDAEFKVFVPRHQNAQFSEDYLRVVLGGAVIQLYRDTELPSGHAAYTWADVRQVDVAMDADAYDWHFEHRILVGLGWLAHEWRHLLGETHG